MESSQLDMEWDEEELLSLVKESEQEEEKDLKTSENKIHATMLSIPFSTLIKPTNILVLDTETNEDNFVLVLGYYIFGENMIHQLVFHEPTDPKFIKNTRLFGRLITYSSYKVAVYNASFESKLFQIPKDKFIETMPMPYTKKDDLISIKTIDQASPRTVGYDIDANKMCEIAFRNVSCIMKTTILLIGLQSYTRFNIKHVIINQLKNYLRGKIYE